MYQSHLPVGLQEPPKCVIKEIAKNEVPGLVESERNACLIATRIAVNRIRHDLRLLRTSTPIVRTRRIKRDQPDDLL